METPEIPLFHGSRIRHFSGNSNLTYSTLSWRKSLWKYENEQIIRMMINLISYRAHINKLNMISYHYWLRKKSLLLLRDLTTAIEILQLKNERESKNKSKKLVRLRNKKRRMMLSWIVFHRFVARPWNDQS